MLKLNNKLNRLGAYTSASLVTGLMASKDAEANSFNSISQTITSQIGGLPGFLTAIAYIMGVIFAVLGILKIKDHVENPSQTPLKEGAIRLAAGGALFVVPIITEAMQNLIGQGGAGVTAESMQSIDSFNAVAP
jgi:hypothetical protein